MSINGQMDKENVVYVCVCVYMHTYIHTMEYDSVILKKQMKSHLL